MKRPNWDTYFLGIAMSVAKRASCPRARVGAVLVSANNRVLSTGYNGAAPKALDCLEAGCDMQDNHCQRALHAEVNAVAFAARAGVSIEGARLYLWRNQYPAFQPCRECLKVLAATGITWWIVAGIGGSGGQISND